MQSYALTYSRLTKEPLKAQGSPGEGDGGASSASVVPHRRGREHTDLKQDTRKFKMCAMHSGPFITLGSQQKKNTNTNIMSASLEKVWKEVHKHTVPTPFSAHNIVSIVKSTARHASKSITQSLQINYYTLHKLWDSHNHYISNTRITQFVRTKLRYSVNTFMIPKNDNSGPISKDTSISMCFVFTWWFQNTVN